MVSRTRNRPGPKVRLSVPQILNWADDHRGRVGAWPNAHSGAISLSAIFNWRKIDNALRYGSFGLEAGSSLAKLLFEERGVRSRTTAPHLSERGILRWADAYYAGQGSWPTVESGILEGEPGECWRNIDVSLRTGARGLLGGSSLPELLALRRGHRHNLSARRLNIPLILRWADEHRHRLGKWPTRSSGAVLSSPRESWDRINWALASGIRGLPKGWSLPELLREHRGLRNKARLPPLSIAKILKWADAFYQKSGVWPTYASKELAEYESWKTIDLALRYGYRSLPSGITLAKLLEKERDVPARRNRREQVTSK